jgi:hypothetical protein
MKNVSPALRVSGGLPSIWITNTPDGVEGHPVVYPVDYVQASKAPMTDFLHKLIGVRYVVHPGGQEFRFRPGDLEELVTLDDLFKGSGQFDPAELAKPAVALLGSLPPLPAGFYDADIHFALSATHCDGQTADRASSCLPAGDTLVLTRHFGVLP